ncbi:hypothetical protein PQU92_09090 [Asticcacaulis sp. BYS171W]|uniref:Uncharacterized protein n=1 Tax=Asticcacaulis aquaticus TaxID=2984212 RepID=A0ABT5HTR9_9CAUL|nr:hypothetical protein [Asticcacaulis aquaticus]MDC7683429.1 hypothetical protein [Asticcacaulis aquaticus]
MIFIKLGDVPTDVLFDIRLTAAGASVLTVANVFSRTGFNSGPATSPRFASWACQIKSDAEGLELAAPFVVQQIARGFPGLIVDITSGGAGVDFSAYDDVSGNFKDSHRGRIIIPLSTGPVAGAQGEVGIWAS